MGIIHHSNLFGDDEDKIRGIYDSLKAMEPMFNTLDHIVNEQEQMVDKLELNISVLKHVGAQKEELLTTNSNQTTNRKQKIFILFILIIILSVIIAFVWYYDRTK